MKLHFKLVYSPVKWLICLIFVCIIPIVMYVPTYYDFVNLTAQYLPFIGIVLFSDIAILDQRSGTEEIAYLSSEKPIQIFLQRYFISIGVFLVYIFLANGIFRILQYSSGEKMIEPVSFFEYVIIVMGGSLFIGGLSMLVSTAFHNIYAGYGCSLVFWLYWNINCLEKSVINPFSFIANPTFYEKPLMVIYGFTAVLLTLTCLLASKSPFYLSEKLRKLFVRTSIPIVDKK